MSGETWTLSLPPGVRLASLNELMRGKLRSRIRLGKEARLLVGWARTQAGVPPATGPREVGIQIDVPKGQRCWDDDAFDKITRDALVACGLLIDDTTRWCRGVPLVYRRWDDRRVPLQFRIVLRDLGEGPLG